MISNLNRNTGYIAVNMIAVYLPLNGVPYNSNIIYIKVFAQYRERISGIGFLLTIIDRTIRRPVIRIEETEVSRRNQIVVAKALVVEYAVFLSSVSYARSAACLPAAVREPS